MSERGPNPLAWVTPLTALALMAGILLGRASAVWYPAAAGLVCAALAFAMTRGRKRRVTLYLAVACLGGLRGWAAYHPALPAEGGYAVTGVIAEEIHRREDGQLRTTLRDVTLDGRPFRAGVYWTCYPDEWPEELTPGMTVRLTARVYHPSGADNPGGFDFREYLLQRGVTLGLYGMDNLTAEDGKFSLTGATARVRHRLTQRLVDAMGRETGGYAAAMLLGNRELIPEEDTEAFRRLGVAHILAVSGYHVAVLAGMLALLMRLLRLPRGLRAALTALLLAAYCLLTGMHAPVVRASLLVLLSQLARLAHRQRLSVHQLAASAILILIAAPAQLTGVSFHLTYGAMLGLTLAAPALQRLRVPKLLRGPYRLLAASASAQLGILLPQIYWFQSMPLLALPVNLAVMAGAGLLMAGYWLTLGLLVCPPLAALVGKAVAFVTGGVLSGIRALGGLPGIELWLPRANLMTALGCALLLAGLSILWTRRRLPPVSLGALLIVLSLLPWPYLGVTYIQFSVGSADAALLRDRDTVVVIDTGEDGQALAGYLCQHRLGVDTLILTHLHTDHAGGIQALLDENIPVDEVILAEGAEAADIDEDMLPLLDALLDRGATLRHVARGDTLSLPDGSLTAVWPERGRVRAGMDANLHSLVLRLELLGTSMLLTGDLDGLYEAYAAVPADILKVAHHGSKASTSAAFLEAVSPEVLVLSGGDEARFLSMDERRGDAALYATQENGAVMIDFTRDGYAVRTMR